MLLLELKVLLDDELFEVVVQNAFEDPFFEDCDVRHAGLLQDEFEEVADGLVGRVDHEPVNDVEQRASLFVAGFDHESLERFNDADRILHVEPHFLQSQIGVVELGIQLGYEQQILFQQDADRIAESVGDQAEFELRVHIDELLDDVVVVAHGEHLVDQKHEREVASGLLEIRLHLEFVPPLACGQLHEIPPDVGALNTRHGEQEVLNQIRLLDFDGECA